MRNVLSILTVLLLYSQLSGMCVTQSAPTSLSAQVSPQKPVTAYFPSGVFDSESADRDKLFSDGAMNYLIAMHEPSLLELSKDPKAETYRLVRFDNPAATGTVLRLRVEPNGAGTLVSITSKSHQLVSTKISEVSKSRVNSFLKLIADDGFWREQQSPLVTKKRYKDGSQWILEGVEDGRYHIVVRKNPEEESLFVAECQSLVSIAQ